MTTDKTESKRHSAVLTAINILLVVQSSHVVKYLNRSMKPTTLMAKHIVVQMDETECSIKQSY